MMGELDISGNSLQLDCSVDSGICVEGATKDLKKKLQEFKRILFILERDKEAMRLLRERLSRIVERKIVKKKKDAPQICNVCFTPIDTDDLKTCVACSSCAKNVCRGEKCSKWVPQDGEWRCQLCTARRDSYGKASTWVEEQYTVKRATPAFASPMRARSEIYIPLCDPNESAFLCNFESVSEAPSPISNNQKQHIREYIEEVLAEMIGGSLDKTSVAPLSPDDSYQRVRNGNELQGISNERLRLLIESIIAETIRQPPFVSSGLTINKTATDTIDHRDVESLALNGNHCNGNGGQYFESKKYQDLLATAVLNKIVNTHGNGRLSGSSPDLTSSSLDNNHNTLISNKADESISSSSSVEPRSESSLTDPIHNLNKDDDLSHIDSYRNFYEDSANDNIEADRESVLSDFIASHQVPLPHISAEPPSGDEDDDEDFISVASDGRDATWEDNWLFKKKKSSKTSAGVGMLVPAPKEDIRALIGDKPTDEVSDLSEAGSDDDSSLEMISASMDPLNDRLVNQHLIGGKNTKIVLDELVEQSSMISTSSLPENVPPYTETKNEFVVSNDGLSEAEPIKISVNSCNAAISNEAINSNVTKNITTKADKLGKEDHTTEEDSIVPPPNDFTDDEKMRNLLAKFNEEQDSKTDSGDDNSSSLSPRSSISCALSAVIGRSDLETYEGITDFCVEDEEAPAVQMDPSDHRRPSVIEILAAIALGPMLAVSASDDRHMLTEVELSSLMELNDLAMAELNTKNAEERNSRLGVIDEESFDDGGHGDEAHLEFVGAVKEPDFLSSPDMVMRAIRELVGNDAKVSHEDDTKDDSSYEDGSNARVVIAEVHSEGVFNEQSVSEEDLSKPGKSVEEECNQQPSLSEDTNAKSPGAISELSVDHPLSTDVADLAKEEATKTIGSPVLESEDCNQAKGIAEAADIEAKIAKELKMSEETPAILHEEAIVCNTALDTTLDSEKPVADSIEEPSNDEQNGKPDTESYPSAVEVYLEATIQINRSLTDSADKISVVDDDSSISNESLRTIGNSSENSEELEGGSISGEETVCSLAELAEDTLQQIKNCEESVEGKTKSRRSSQANEFILPPPRQFSDEKVNDDDQNIDTVQVKEAHTVEHIESVDMVQTVKEEDIKTHNEKIPGTHLEEEHTQEEEHTGEDDVTTTSESVVGAASIQTEKSEEPPDKQLILSYETKEENEPVKDPPNQTSQGNIILEETSNNESSVEEMHVDKIDEREEMTGNANEIPAEQRNEVIEIKEALQEDARVNASEVKGDQHTDSPCLNTTSTKTMPTERVAELETETNRSISEENPVSAELQSQLKETKPDQEIEPEEKSISALISEGNTIPIEETHTMKSQAIRTENSIADNKCNTDDSSNKKTEPKTEETAAEGSSTDPAQAVEEPTSEVSSQEIIADTAVVATIKENKEDFQEPEQVNAEVKVVLDSPAGDISSVQTSEATVPEQDFAETKAVDEKRTNTFEVETETAAEQAANTQDSVTCEQVNEHSSVDEEALEKQAATDQQKTEENVSEEVSNTVEESKSVISETDLSLAILEPTIESSETEEPATADVATVEQFFTKPNVEDANKLKSEETEGEEVLKEETSEKPSETISVSTKSEDDEKINVSQYLEELAAKEQAEKGQLKAINSDIEVLEPGHQPDASKNAEETHAHESVFATSESSTQTLNLEALEKQQDSGVETTETVLSSTETEIKDLDAKKPIEVLGTVESQQRDSTEVGSTENETEASQHTENEEKTSAETAASMTEVKSTGAELATEISYPAENKETTLMEESAATKKEEAVATEQVTEATEIEKTQVFGVEAIDCSKQIESASIEPETKEVDPIENQEKIATPTKDARELTSDNCKKNLSEEIDPNQTEIPSEAQTTEALQKEETSEKIVSETQQIASIDDETSLEGSAPESSSEDVLNTIVKIKEIEGQIEDAAIEDIKTSAEVSASELTISSIESTETKAEDFGAESKSAEEVPAQAEENQNADAGFETNETSSDANDTEAKAIDTAIEVETIEEAPAPAAENQIANSAIEDTEAKTEDSAVEVIAIEVSNQSQSGDSIEAHETVATAEEMEQKQTSVAEATEAQTEDSAIDVKPTEELPASVKENSNVAAEDSETKTDDSALAVKSIEVIPDPTELNQNAGSVVEVDETDTSSEKVEQIEDPVAKTNDSAIAVKPTEEVLASEEENQKANVAAGNAETNTEDSVLESNGVVPDPAEQDHNAGSVVEVVETKIEDADIKTENSAIDVKPTEEVETSGEEKQNENNIADDTETKTEDSALEDKSIEVVRKQNADSAIGVGETVATSEKLELKELTDGKTEDSAIAVKPTEEVLASEENQNSNVAVENSEAKTEDFAVDITQTDQVAAPTEEEQSASSVLEANEPLSAPKDEEPRESFSVKLEIEDFTGKAEIKEEAAHFSIDGTKPKSENSVVSIESNELTAATIEKEQGACSPVETIEAETEDLIDEVSTIEGVSAPTEENQNGGSAVVTNEVIHPPEGEEQQVGSVDAKGCATEKNLNVGSVIQAKELITAPLEGEQGVRSDVEPSEAIEIEVQITEEILAVANPNTGSVPETNQPIAALTEEEQGTSFVETSEAKTENVAVEIKPTDEIPAPANPSDISEPIEESEEGSQKANSAVEVAEAATEDVKAAEENSATVKLNPKEDLATEVTEPIAALTEKEQTASSSVETVEDSAVGVKVTEEIPAPAEEKPKRDPSLEACETIAATTEEGQKASSTAEENRAIETIDTAVTKEATEAKADDSAVDVEITEEPKVVPEDNTKEDPAIDASEPTTSPIEEEQQTITFVETIEAKIEDCAVGAITTEEVSVPIEEHPKIDSATIGNEPITTQTEENQQTISTVEAKTDVITTEDSADEVKVTEDVEVPAGENKKEDPSIEITKPITRPTEEKQNVISAVEATETKTDNSVVVVEATEKVTTPVDDDTKDDLAFELAVAPAEEGEHIISAVEAKIDDSAVEVKATEEAPAQAEDNSKEDPVIEASEPLAPPTKGEQQAISPAETIDATIENSTIGVKASEEVLAPAEDDSKKDSAIEVNKPITVPTEEEEHTISTVEAKASIAVDLKSTEEASAQAKDNSKDDPIIEANESIASPTEEEQQKVSSAENVEAKIEDSAVEVKVTEEVPAPLEECPKEDSASEGKEPIAAPTEEKEHIICAVEAETDDSVVDVKAADEVPTPAKEDLKEDSATEVIEKIETPTEEGKHIVSAVEAETEDSIKRSESVTSSTNEEQQTISSAETIETQSDGSAVKVKITEEVSAPAADDLKVDCATEVNKPIAVPTEEEEHNIFAVEDKADGSAVDSKTTEEAIAQTEDNSKEDPVIDANEPIASTIEEEQQTISSAVTVEVKIEDSAVEVKVTEEVPATLEECPKLDSATETIEPIVTPTEEGEHIVSTVEAKTDDTKIDVKAIEEVQTSKSIESPTNDEQQTISSAETIETHSDDSVVEVKATKEVSAPAKDGSKVDSATEVNKPIVVLIEKEEHTISAVEAKADGSAVELKTTEEASAQVEDNSKDDPVIEANESTPSATEEEQQTISSAEDDPKEDPATEPIKPIVTPTEKGEHIVSVVEAKTDGSTIDVKATEKTPSEVEANSKKHPVIEAIEPIASPTEGEQQTISSAETIETQSEDFTVEVKTTKEVPVPKEDNPEIDFASKGNESIAAPTEEEQKTISVVEVKTTEEVEGPAEENPKEDHSIEVTEPITVPADKQNDISTVETTETKTDGSVVEATEEIPAATEENPKEDSATEGIEPILAALEEENSSTVEAETDDSAIDVKATVEATENTTVDSAVDMKAIVEAPATAEDAPKVDSASEGNEPIVAPIKEEHTVSAIEAGTDDSAIDVKATEEVQAGDNFKEDPFIEGSKSTASSTNEEQETISSAEAIETQSDGSAEEAKATEEVSAPTEENPKEDLSVKSGEPNAMSTEKEQPTISGIDANTESSAVDVKPTEEVPTPAIQMSPTPIAEIEKVYSADESTETTTDNSVVDVKSTVEAPATAENDPKEGSATDGNELIVTPADKEERAVSIEEGKSEDSAVNVEPTEEVPAPEEDDPKLDSATEGSEPVAAPTEEVEINTGDSAVDVKVTEEVPASSIEGSEPLVAPADEKQNVSSVVEVTGTKTDDSAVDVEATAEVIAPADDNTKGDFVIKDSEAIAEKQLQIISAAETTTESSTVEVKTSEEIPALTEKSKKDPAVECGETCAEPTKNKQQTISANEANTEDSAVAVKAAEEVPAATEVVAVAEDNSKEDPTIAASEPIASPAEEKQQTISSPETINATIEDAVMDVKATEEVSSPGENEIKVDSVNEPTVPPTALTENSAVESGTELSSKPVLNSNDILEKTDVVQTGVIEQNDAIEQHEADKQALVVEDTKNTVETEQNAPTEQVETTQQTGSPEPTEDSLKIEAIKQIEAVDQSETAEKIEVIEPKATELAEVILEEEKPKEETPVTAVESDESQAKQEKVEIEVLTITSAGDVGEIKDNEPPDVSKQEAKIENLLPQIKGPLEAAQSEAVSDVEPSSISEGNELLPKRKESLTSEGDNLKLLRENTISKDLQEPVQVIPDPSLAQEETSVKTSDLKESPIEPKEDLSIKEILTTLNQEVEGNETETPSSEDVREEELPKECTAKVEIEQIEVVSIEPPSVEFVQAVTEESCATPELSNTTSEDAPMAAEEIQAKDDSKNIPLESLEVLNVPNSVTDAPATLQEIAQEIVSEQNNAASKDESVTAKTLIGAAQTSQEPKAVSEDDPVYAKETIPKFATEQSASSEVTCIGFTTAEVKASGVKVETISDYSSQVCDAITETITEQNEIPPIALVSASCKIVTHPVLHPTESLSDSAQYPPEVYDKISHPVLEVSHDKRAPCLAEELRMATNKNDKTRSASNRVIPQTVACEDRCFESDSKPSESTVATAQPNAQGNPINDSQNSFTTQSKSSTFARPTATSTTKSKYSGSQFRNLTLRDRRFLAELEKRRKQRELIQNYLDSLDCIVTPNYLNEDLYLVEIESKCSVIERSPYSLFIEPPDYCIVDATSSSPTTKKHFLNNIPFSDPISSESNGTDDSTPTVIDTFGSSLRESGSHSDSGDEFSPDDSTDRDSSATATTANNSTNATQNVTNQSHINSPPLTPPELRTESACSKLLKVETRTSGGNAEHVDDDPLKHLVPGSIAEREYKKWYNAVDMPNNPYSVEALRRRLSGGLDRVLDLPNISPSVEESPLKLGEDASTETADKSQERDYARYSRDYYINDAKHASGANKKSFTTPATPSPTPTSSSIEIEEGVEVTSETIPPTPVRDLCHKLEKQCRIDADIYLATPVLIEEDIPQIFAARSDSQVVASSLTTEAVSKLSSDSSSILTTSSLTPSEDSDTIRIYDLKKQETRLVKETINSDVPKSPVKKSRPTELDITPVLSPSVASVSSKVSTPTLFKFLQPKRKLIEPSQVLSIDLDTTPIPTPSSEKPVIEAEVVHAMPSVKALAKAFLLSSSSCSTTDNKWRKASRAKSPLQLFKLPTPAAKVIPKQPEPVIADTLSQGSEDATIASDLSSLETDPPSKHETDSTEQSSGSVLISGCLRNNIAFFENLKNK